MSLLFLYCNISYEISAVRTAGGAERRKPAHVLQFCCNKCTRLVEGHLPASDVPCGGNQGFLSNHECSTTKVSDQPSGMFLGRENTFNDILRDNVKGGKFHFLQKTLVTDCVKEECFLLS